jgi:hypothetical protein
MIIAFVVGGAFADAQYKNVVVNGQGGDPEEVTIAINPANPDNIIAGANLRYVFCSFDGGKTWTQNVLPNGTFGDPCIIFDDKGRAYYAHLSSTWEAITLRYSDDGGKTWPHTVKLYGPSSDSAKPGSYFNSSLQDKEWLCADMTTSPYHGYVYASWTDFTRYGSARSEDSSVIVFSRSTNRGETFEKFVRVSDMAGDALDDDNTMEGAVPAVGPAGEVYIGWSGPAGLYFDRSFDGGVTWEKDKIITSTPGGWAFDISGISRCNGLPITCCDISNSAHRGTVYINWIDHRNGDPDVFIIKSTDKGMNWSAPIRVNNDAIGNGRAQFLTWMSVDPKTGEIAIVFYDRRNRGGDTTDVYLAQSTDGGATFTNTCISTEPFLPTADVFFGDYNGISAYDGRIRPVWTWLQDYVLNTFTALIDPMLGVDRPLPENMRFDLTSSPNPLSAETGFTSRIRFTLKQRGAVQILIYDQAGRLADTVANRTMNSGPQVVEYNANNLPSGVYRCRLVYTNSATSAEVAESTQMTVTH